MKNEIKLDNYLKYSDTAVKDAIDAELSVSELAQEDMVIKRISCDEELSCGDEEKAMSTGYASTRRMDFSGDVVVPEGVDLRVFDKNPVIFFNHYKKEKPIGKAVNTQIDDYGVKIDIEYAVEQNPEANTVYKLVKGGFLRQHSIGFLPLQAYHRGNRGFEELNTKLMQKYPEYSGEANRIITKSLLLEVSVVGIADNQSATISEVKNMEILEENDYSNLKSLGIALDEVKEIKEEPEIIEEKEIELNITKVEDYDITLIKSAQEIREEYLCKMAKQGKLVFK
jgi:HK97 family phage prohead protease